MPGGPRSAILLARGRAQEAFAEARLATERSRPVKDPQTINPVLATEARAALAIGERAAAESLADELVEAWSATGIRQPTELSQSRPGSSGSWAAATEVLHALDERGDRGDALARRGAPDRHWRARRRGRRLRRDRNGARRGLRAAQGGGGVRRGRRPGERRSPAEPRSACLRAAARDRVDCRRRSALGRVSLSRSGGRPSPGCRVPASCRCRRRARDARPRPRPPARLPPHPPARRSSRS